MKEYSDEDLFNTKIADQLLEKLRLKTSKKCVEFKLQPGITGVKDSKVGGVPFVPKNGTYPVNTKTGEKLHFLIQLNFEDIPHIEPYPTSGILQIFISCDDLYGADFDDPQNQESWRILYFEDVKEAMSRDEVQKIMPEVSDEEWDLPFEKPHQEFILKFNETEMPITVNSYNFDELLKNTCKDIMPEELKKLSWYQLPNSISDKLNDELYGENSRLGGYAGFTQTDPRYNTEFKKYELLLQLDSEGNDSEWYLMWGDSGIANFFIDPEDLKKRDFSKVYYNWDCC